MEFDNHMCSIRGKWIWFLEFAPPKKALHMHQRELASAQISILLKNKL
jgi:hypothetical protein